MDMALLTDLRRRVREPEVMDGPDLDPADHRRALRGLARLNWWSRAARLLLEPLLAMSPAGRLLRVLDLACGGGDVTVGLARLGGSGFRVDGCDRSPLAVEEAAARAARAKVESSFFTGDVVGEPLPWRYDVLVSSLFLHHLADDDAADLLRRMARAARVGLVVGDLERRRRGLVLAAAATRVLTRSPVVRTDALRSVRASFTRDELAALAGRAGLEGFRIDRCWPGRLRLVWRRP